jgi:ubiquinone/menaquinone biosynthesis C-methylase UbiE
MHMSEQEKKLTPERIMQLAWGFAPPMLLEAAVRHGIFDLLDEAPKTLPQVAQATGASERGLRALLNGLVGLQLLAKDGDRYDLTPESRAFLVSTRSAYYGGFFHHISTQLIPGFTQLTEIVRTGRPAAAMNQQGPGSEFFEQFVEDLVPLSFASARGLAGALRVGEATEPIRVLDIAAGSGVWGIALAQASPQVRVTAADWAGVIPVTRRVAARFGVADRFTYLEGDIDTTDFGAGYHIATLGHILHSEGAPRSRRLLQKVADALVPGGTVAIAEFIPNEERTGPPQPLLFAVNMLVNTEEGDVFTFSEMKGWLEEAGFRDVRTLDVPAPSPLVLATRA